MKDPFCKNEPLDPEMEKMVERNECGYCEHDEPIDDAPDDFEGPVWRNPDGTVVNFPPVPMSVRYLPKDTSIEVKKKYRGKYVGEGFLIVDKEYMCSIYNDDPFIREWRTVNSHCVAIQPEWKIERI
jgi:hypothetical protein